MPKYSQSYELPPQLDLLSSLIKTGPLYSSDEGRASCASQLADSLQGFGWDVMVQPYMSAELSDDPLRVAVEEFGDMYAGDATLLKQNVIGVLDSGKPGNTLILNGHYDVEPIANPAEWTNEWNSGKIAQGKVWGRGASDMLGGLTSQLFVGSRFANKPSDWAGRIIFTAVPDEEIGGNGTLAAIHMLKREGLIPNDSSAVACLIAEPSDRVIGLRSLGFMHMALRAEGVARHMAGAALGDNVLYDIMSVISGFEGLLNDAARRIDETALRPLHAFGIINGGIDAATPMPSVEAEATILYAPELPATRLQEEIYRSVNATNSKVFATFSDFLFDGQRTVPNALSDSLIATRSLAAAEAGTFPSPCDARLFALSGVPNVITYGPGSLAEAHRANEFIAVPEIANYNRHVEVALREYLRE